MKILPSMFLCFLLGSVGWGADPVPRHSVFGDKEYIEYVAGDLPVVISAPHGGHLKPDEMPDRAKGVLQMDGNTQELARAIGAESLARTGHSPHLIICRVHRVKLDCNREIVEAAAGDPIAEKAWGEYHAFIDRAVGAAKAQAGKVFCIDLHGQGHKDKRIELGYLHTQKTLALPAEALNAPGVAAEGSLRRIAAGSNLSYVELLRGPRSLGGLLQAQGFPCTPSPERPVPNLPYFDGGYTVRRHVAAGQPIAGLQIECNNEGLRDTAENRARFAKALVTVLREFLPEQFGLTLPRK